MLARGPLPVPSEGREHEIHNACGGAGCDGCRGTGYRTMGPAAIHALERRIAALLDRFEPEGRAQSRPAPVIPEPAPVIPEPAPVILDAGPVIPDAGRARQLSLF
jgi:hypothetical protein